MSRDRIVGTILGGAIGDGWGSSFERGAPPASAPAPSELVITDDTQLTLATCEAIIETGNVDPAMIAERFVVWFRAGRLSGLGSSTLKALRDLDAGAHWALSGARGERAAGNGAAMRIAPLAYCLDPAEHDERTILRDVCRITHHHDEAYVGALAVCLAVRLASGVDFTPDTMLNDIYEQLPDSQIRDRLVTFSGTDESASTKDLARKYGSSGFVAESVPIAIHAAREIGKRSFAEVVQRAIESGGDTDTIGSIAGQIAGAAVGVDALPTDLIARLRDGREVMRIARAFGERASSS